MARIMESSHANVVGERVKLLRKSRHLSQQELSSKLELLGVYVCRGSVSRIEDHTRTVTDAELYALAKVLQVKVTELYEVAFLEEIG